VFVSINKSKSEVSLPDPAIQQCLPEECFQGFDRLKEEQLSAGLKGIALEAEVHNNIKSAFE
jgi:hypothetical protein